VAVTVTVDVPVIVGVPEISPLDASIVNPAGRPLAAYVSVPPSLSDAWTWRLTAVPTVVLWLPGFVTVTVGPPPPPLQRAPGSVEPTGVPRPDAMSNPAAAVYAPRFVPVLSLFPDVMSLKSLLNALAAAP
jgi:hypothetical protein